MTLLGPEWSNPGGNPHKRRLLYWPCSPFGKPMDAEIFLEPRDVWIGLFFDTRRGEAGTVWESFTYRHFYLCVLPCLPLHIWWRVLRPAAPGEGA